MAHRDVPSKVLSNSENTYCGHTLLNQQVPNFGFKLCTSNLYLRLTVDKRGMSIGMSSKNQRWVTKSQGRRFFAYVSFNLTTGICVMKKLIFHANTESSCGDH